MCRVKILQGRDEHTLLTLVARVQGKKGHKVISSILVKIIHKVTFFLRSTTQVPFIKDENASHLTYQLVGKCAWRGGSLLREEA